MRIFLAMALSVGVSAPAIGQGAMDVPCEDAYVRANKEMWDRLQNFPAVYFTRDEAFYAAASQVQYDLWWSLAAYTDRDVFYDHSVPFVFKSDDAIKADRGTLPDAETLRTLAEMFFLTERIEQCASAGGPLMNLNGDDMVALWRNEYPDAQRERVRLFLEQFL